MAGLQAQHIQKKPFGSPSSPLHAVVTLRWGPGID